MKKLFFILPLLLTYGHYYVLMEADFLSVRPKFENTDLDCFLFTKKQIFIEPSVFPCSFWGTSGLAEHFSCFYYQVTFPQVETLVLRC